jgi:hypothetical protein
MESLNPNDIARDIQEGVKQGRFKDCLNLCVGDNRGYCTGGFFTHCKKSALDKSSFKGDIITVGELHCPKDCHFFESRLEAQLEEVVKQREKPKRERSERRRQRFDNIVRFVAAPFKWFGQLPWQTQLVIIIPAILLFSPKWVPVLIDLIRAKK